MSAAQIFLRVLHINFFFIRPKHQNNKKDNMWYISYTLILCLMLISIIKKIQKKKLGGDIPNPVKTHKSAWQPERVLQAF